MEIMMNIVVHALFRIPLYVEVAGKQMCVRALKKHCIAEHYDRLIDGMRPATREELVQFAALYEPSKFLKKTWIHGTNRCIKDTMFGTTMDLYAINGYTNKVEPVVYNPLWGIPKGTLFLWVKENQID